MDWFAIFFPLSDGFGIWSGNKEFESLRPGGKTRQEGEGWLRCRGRSGVGGGKEVGRPKLLSIALIAPFLTFVIH